MLDYPQIRISDEIGVHDELVKKLDEAGFFTMPNNKQDKAKTGHIHVKDPKENCPENDLPVAYIDRDRVLLVNSEYKRLGEYHDRIRTIIGEFMSSDY